MIAQGYALLKRFEGLRLQRYLCPAGVPTIGYGTTHWFDGGPIPPGAVITPEQAERFLVRDVSRFELGVYRLVRGLPPECHAALTSFSYNLGLGALAGSTLLRRVRAERWDDAAEQFQRWVFAGGKRLSGLVRRREAERVLFMEGVVDLWLDGLEQKEAA